VILYNLGIGATEKELKWVFEGDDEFSALPTFGVIPQFACSSAIPLDWLPNFNPVSSRIQMTGGHPSEWKLQAKLLHGEQYLNIKGPIPTSGELVSEARSVIILPGPIPDIYLQVCRLLEVLDKGKAAAVTTIIETRDKSTGKLIFENQSTVFIRGSGGFGGKRTGNG
jgi:multifunctional beta-oxidation protein